MSIALSVVSLIVLMVSLFGNRNQDENSRVAMFLSAACICYDLEKIIVLLGGK